MDAAPLFAPTRRENEMTRGVTPGDRIYRAGWIVTGAGFALALSFFLISGATLRLDSALILGIVVVPLMVAHSFYLRIRPDRHLAALTGGIAMMICAGSVAGAISLLGLSFRLPMIDDQLAAADRMIGFPAPAFVQWCAARPMVADLLGLAYISSFPLLFLSAIALSAMKCEHRAWELCFMFATCILAAVLCATFFPAVAAFTHYGIPPEIRAGLPVGSGIYHLPALHAFREGAAVVLDPLSLQGVVTFPSFHTALALMTIAAWRGIPSVFWPMLAWNAVVIVSTIPIGGHYGVDLIGGALLWVAVMRFALRIRPPAAD